MVRCAGWSSKADNVGGATILNLSSGFDRYSPLRNKLLWERHVLILSGARVLALAEGHTNRNGGTLRGRQESDTAVCTWDSYMPARACVCTHNCVQTLVFPSSVH